MGQQVSQFGEAFVHGVNHAQLIGYVQVFGRLPYTAFVKVDYPVPFILFFVVFCHDFAGCDIRRVPLKCPFGCPFQRPILLQESHKAEVIAYFLRLGRENDCFFKMCLGSVGIFLLVERDESQSVVRFCEIRI